MAIVDWPSLMIVLNDRSFFSQTNPFFYFFNLSFPVSLVAILLSFYYLFLWNPYNPKNGNFSTTRTFINSEILFIEKTNYFDVDLTSHPHGVIGSSPESIHLAPVRVKLNQTESKISKLPLLAAEEPASVEQFGLTSINRGSLNGATLNSLGTSEELDGATINGGSSINVVAGRPTGGRAMTALALKRSVADKSSGSTSSATSALRNSMVDSDPVDYSGENSNAYKPKFVNLLQQSANKVKAGI